MTDRRLQSIQALRGVAILLVLTRHIMVMEQNFGGGEALLPTEFKMGDSGVDLFFVISGFVMVLVTEGRFRTPGATVDFLHRRVARIYPLYWLFSLVVLGVFLIAPSLVRTMQRGEYRLVTSFLLLPDSFPPLLGQGWTLTHEVYFYLVFTLALVFPERFLSRFLLSWGLFVAIGCNLYSEVSSRPGHATLKLITNPLTVEFIMGCCAALAIRRGWRRGRWLSLVGGACLLPASAFFFDPLEIPGSRFFCYALPSLLLLYGAVTSEQQDKLRFPRWLRSLGDASYSIYLSHVLVISFVGRTWQSMRQPGPWDNGLAVFLMAATAIAIGLACYRWIEQPHLRAFHLRNLRSPSASLPESGQSPTSGLAVAPGRD